ncbi:MAG: hypothetical protein KKD05_08890 [Candidatus Omnitrophica bacterium]|nr:hypothetical protein [Candidatus Omnitrophota bacterium]
MNKLLSKSWVRIISIVLIQAFLILDIAWAGGTELSVVTPDKMLSAQVQISQLDFALGFDKFYKVKDQALAQEDILTANKAQEQKSVGQGRSVIKQKAIEYYQQQTDTPDASVIDQISSCEIPAYYLEKARVLNKFGVSFEVVANVKQVNQGVFGTNYISSANVSEDDKNVYEFTGIDIKPLTADKNTELKDIIIVAIPELKEFGKNEAEMFDYYVKELFFYADFTNKVKEIVANIVELKNNKTVDALIAMDKYSASFNFANTLTIIRALGQLKDNKAVDFLIQQLKDKGVQERTWADTIIDALEQVGVDRDKSIESLIDAAIAKLDNQYTKTKAAYVLQSFGVKAKRALPALRESLKAEPETKSRMVGHDGISDVPAIGQVEEENITCLILKNIIENIEALDPSIPKMQKTGRKTVEVYFDKVKQMEKDKEITKIDHEDIRFAMDKDQKDFYIAKIIEVMKTKKEEVITPAILFEAAALATENDHSDISARIGLQPGTMNPLHYGHISASLAGIISEKLDMVLLANGGTVPDKPYAASADIRNEMAQIAVNEQGEANKLGLNQWLEVTPIRKETVEMFSGNEELLSMAGKDESARRFNMDMAGFIWMFVANPNVEWVYLVGSDKVGAKGEKGYGEKDEVGLIKDTLAKAKVKIVYFERTGKEVDVKNQIEKYPWLHELWKSNFKRSDVGSFADLAAVKIRKALSDKNDIPTKDRIVGNHPLDQSIPQGVIDYITADTAQGRQLRFLYPLENEEKAADKLVKQKKLEEGLQAYQTILNKIDLEKEKSDDQRQASMQVLESAAKSLNKKIAKMDLQNKAIEQIKDTGLSMDKLNILNTTSSGFIMQAI